eukprot:m.177524 g.177524  ORF g.177524 m.177524 type:complete len:103 (-) comp15351_c0_seq1:40-348(-)
MYLFLLPCSSLLIFCSRLLFLVLTGLFGTELTAEWQYTIVASPLLLDETFKGDFDKVAHRLVDGIKRAVGFRQEISLKGRVGDAVHRLAKDIFATYVRPAAK